jgi:sugar lactone lactonase YvrE
VRLSDAKKRISQRVAMAIGVLVVLVAFACLTGCGSGRSHATTAISVADSDNNRVLIYDTPLSDDQSANVVLGQADFVSNGAALTASGMSAPGDTVEDNLGSLYVSDQNNSRILIFQPPFTNGMSASLVIGQPDFVTGAANVTTSGLSGPVGMAFDHSGNLWVSDFLSNRILQFLTPFTNGMSASLVIGQADFVSNAVATTSSGLAAPGLIAFDAGGNLWVTDGGNNRALEFKPPFADGMAASLVIGQADFVSSGSATTASGLNFPSGVAFDRAGNLWLGDGFNNRVLRFEPAFANGMSANLVLGQPDFVTATNNTSQSGFHEPLGIAFDSSGNLAVADAFNNRSLAFKPPFSNNQNANRVLGQPDFVTATAATTATGQFFPTTVRPLF